VILKLAAAVLALLLTGRGGPDVEACEQAVRDAMAESLAGVDEEISSDDVNVCRGLSEEDQFREILGRVIFGGEVEEST
jgi:hypothetical protein